MYVEVILLARAGISVPNLTRNLLTSKYGAGAAFWLESLLLEDEIGLELDSASCVLDGFSFELSLCSELGLDIVPWLFQDLVELRQTLLNSDLGGQRPETRSRDSADKM